MADPGENGSLYAFFTNENVEFLAIRKWKGKLCEIVNYVELVGLNQL
jgi:hypothetical protein